MKKDSNMKPENKKNFPGIFFFFVVGLIAVLIFQNLSESKSAGVSFSHQVEHLVNLDLINGKESRKTSLNDNLVTFSGAFHESLSDSAKERYRYLSLLAQNHDLKAGQTNLLNELKLLQSQAYDAAAYFLSIAGIKIPDGGYVVISKSFDSFDRFNSIVIKEISNSGVTITLPKLKSLYEASTKDASSAHLSAFGRGLQGFLEEIRSPKVGIGNEAIKRTLREIEISVEKGLAGSNLEQYEVFEKAYKDLEIIVGGLLKEEQGVKLYELRSTRNYLEYLGMFEKLSADLAKNSLQLDKARVKVASAIWFFHNQEVSTKALEKINPDEFSRWFLAADAEWKAFEENKGLTFKSPDQPRSAVLERTFKSEEPTPNYFNYLFTFLPIILVALLLYFIFSRQMKGVGSGAMNFGKSPAKLLNKSSQKITFDDVAGIDETKEELEEIVDFLKEPAKYTKLGAKIPKGVLLIGAPGTGKTLIAKAVSGEAGVPFFSISGSDFVEMFVGVGASRVRDLFDQARKSSPCIIFIDEIDAVGRHRGSGLGGGHDEREQTLNQLLVEMDGIEPSESVIIIAATNRPDVLDKALLRPGRFDRSVVVNLPDMKGRLAILKVHVKNVKMAEDVNLKELAARSVGMAGADLANLVNEAALLAAKKRKTAVTQDDLRHAHDKVAFGKERRSLVMEEEDKISTAYHEGGHALAALILNSSDPVSKVTIIPRARSLGATHFDPKINRVTLKKSECLDQLVVLMGGRVAEEILNKDGSSGAQMDIQQATSMARSMVCEWGMSEKVGMIRFSDGNDSTLISGFHEKAYSEETAKLIDSEIKGFLDNAYKRAVQILNDNFDKLKQIADMLMEFETLERADLDKIMDGTFDVAAKKKEIETVEVTSRREPPPLPQAVVSKKSRKKPLTDQMKPI
jgi:cell division protease FtsH